MKPKVAPFVLLGGTWLLLAGCGGKSLLELGENAADGAEVRSTGPTHESPQPPDPLVRASNFEYKQGCAEFDSVGLTDEATGQGRETRLLERRTRPTAVEACDSDGGSDCWKLIDNCEVDYPLDRSQWPSDSTVLAIFDLDPSRLNPLRSTLRVDATEGGRFVVDSFYYMNGDSAPPDSPPGCVQSDNCGQYWYLDTTDTGIALVICPALAVTLRDLLGQTSLSLCLVD